MTNAEISRLSSDGGREDHSYSLEAPYSVRPVSENMDTWCKIKGVLSDEEKASEAPYGYLVSTPLVEDGQELEVGGTIVRNRLNGGMIELQVQPYPAGKEPDKMYFVWIEEREGQKACVTIRNHMKPKNVNYG